MISHGPMRRPVELPAGRDADAPCDRTEAADDTQSDCTLLLLRCTLPLYYVFVARRARAVYGSGSGQGTTVNQHSEKRIFFSPAKSTIDRRRRARAAAALGANISGYIRRSPDIISGDIRISAHHALCTEQTRPHGLQACSHVERGRIRGGASANRAIQPRSTCHLL